MFGWGMDRITTELMGPPGAEDFSGQRHAQRDSLFLAAQLSLDGAAAVTVRVRNLSEGGLMAEYPDGAEVGTPLEIDVRNVGWVKGRVAWSAAGRIGIAFDKSIDPKRARTPVGGGTRTPHFAKALITR